MKQVAGNRKFSSLMLTFGIILIAAEGVSIAGGGRPQALQGIFSVLSWLGIFLPLITGALSVVLGIRIRKCDRVGKGTLAVLTVALSFCYIVFYTLSAGIGIPYVTSICMMLFPALAAHFVGRVSCVVVALAYPYIQLLNLPTYMQSEKLVACMPVQMVSGFLASLAFVLALYFVSNGRWSRRIVAILCGLVNYSIVMLVCNIITLCIIEGSLSALSIDVGLIVGLVLFAVSIVAQVYFSKKKKSVE